MGERPGPTTHLPGGDSAAVPAAGVGRLPRALCALSARPSACSRGHLCWYRNTLCSTGHRRLIANKAFAVAVRFRSWRIGLGWVGPACTRSAGRSASAPSPRSSRSSPPAGPPGRRRTGSARAASTVCPGRQEPRSTGSVSRTRQHRPHRHRNANAPQTPRCCAAYRRPPAASNSWRQTISNSAMLSPWHSGASRRGSAGTAGHPRHADEELTETHWTLLNEWPYPIRRRHRPHRISAGQSHDHKRSLR